MASVQMTEGRIAPQLVSYAIPLILGNLFQLAYNTIDSVIAGRFIGQDALAAEGIAAPVMNLVILGLNGVCIGAGVLMSERFGAGDGPGLRRVTGTALTAGTLFSLLAALLGILFTPLIMQAMNVPDNILRMTGIYLRITFLGAPFTCLYNALAQSLKSIGDSKTPLKFLMFSSILNAVLDLVFIGLLGFGIVCSAVTTVAAQAVSVLLCALYIARRIPELQLRPDELRIHAESLRQILRYGSITALQHCVQPIGKLLIQGQINALGVSAIAAFNACTRMDDFACIPAQNIGHAETTFIAQNRGAGKRERIRRGFRVGYTLELCHGLFIFAVTYLLRGPIISLFVAGDGSGEVIRLGVEYLTVMSFMYVFPACTNGLQGFWRGMGRMSTTLLLTSIQVTIRVIATYLLAPRIGIVGIAWACSSGWSMMLIVGFSIYARFLRKEKL